MAGSYRQADSDEGKGGFTVWELPSIAVNSEAFLTLFLRLVFSRMCTNWNKTGI